MRRFLLAAVFGLTASQASAVAFGFVTGSVGIGLEVTDGDPSALEVSYFDEPTADAIIEEIETNGILDLSTSSVMPDPADPPLPFAMSGTASASAQGGPPSVPGSAFGFIDLLLFSTIDLFNNGSSPLTVELTITYALSAMASIDRPFDEISAGFGSLSILYIDALGDMELTPDADVGVIGDVLPFEDLVFADGNSPIIVSDLIIPGDDFATLDVEMSLQATAIAAPIPVPPALALLPAGLGMLALVSRRRQRRATERR